MSLLPNQNEFSLESAEWCEALQQVHQVHGEAYVGDLLQVLLQFARQHKMALPASVGGSTVHANTIAATEQPAYPGDEAIEQRIENLVRWNAAMMVARANMLDGSLGGHLSTFASSATLYEVGFNHFFRGHSYLGDQIFYQGHATPGMYARAYLAGELSEQQLLHFRRETAGKGLSSYPHPYLMPHFWQFPTVSMGLGPIHAIYQARFNRYLQHRGLLDTSPARVWAFLGDGECDEPETTGALGVATREHLNNLVFVINCNLQRLDGPVRGNGKIVQELESLFHGAGWQVIKVLWSEEWDDLLAQDVSGDLLQTLGKILDGDMQRLGTMNTAELLQALAGFAPQLAPWLSQMAQTPGLPPRLRRGGHSRQKMYAAYHQAMQSKQPVCILAHTVKGWQLGEGFAGSNVTHQMKKLTPQQLLSLRDTLQIPLTDAQASAASWYHPGAKSEEIAYLLARRKQLGGALPRRLPGKTSLSLPAATAYTDVLAGSKEQAVSTTMACVRLLRNLLRDANIGRYVVPIVPDEARTFGMDAFFREFGIYASSGQHYTPVDASKMLHYHETQSGQLLEEGITECGAMASVMAAATAYSTFDVPTIPFYMFYSMFGMQRTGDQMWALGDARGRGFLLGATAGRTTLSGEGLQHADGHSLLMAQPFFHMQCFDCAYGYELATVVEEGLINMLENRRDTMYYLPLYNENYPMPALPDHITKADILSGIYCVSKAQTGKHPVQLWASGPMLPLALEAAKVLQTLDIAASVYSVTSYQRLYREAVAATMPQSYPEKPHRLGKILAEPGMVVACSDWVGEIPSLLGRFIGPRLVVLGTNDFGRSDTRAALRRFFAVDSQAMVHTALLALLKERAIKPAVLRHWQSSLKKP